MYSAPDRIAKLTKVNRHAIVDVVGARVGHVASAPHRKLAALVAGLLGVNVADCRAVQRLDCRGYLIGRLRHEDAFRLPVGVVKGPVRCFRVDVGLSGDGEKPLAEAGLTKEVTLNSRMTMLVFCIVFFLVIFSWLFFIFIFSSFHASYLLSKHFHGIPVIPPREKTSIGTYACFPRRLGVDRSSHAEECHQTGGRKKGLGLHFIGLKLKNEGELPEVCM